MNFMLFNDGKYFYGEWKDGKPHGLNVYWNKSFVVFANYSEGKPISQAIAIEDHLIRLMVFNGEEMQLGRHQ